MNPLEALKQKLKVKPIVEEKEITLYPNPTSDVVYFMGNKEFVNYYFILLIHMVSHLQLKQRTKQ